MRWGYPPLDINPVFPGLGDILLSFLLLLLLLFIIIIIIIIIIQCYAGNTISKKYTAIICEPFC